MQYVQHIITYQLWPSSREAMQSRMLLEAYSVSTRKVVAVKTGAEIESEHAASGPENGESGHLNPFRANSARRYYVNNRVFLSFVDVKKSEESDDVPFEVISSVHGE
ncbi:hypothetical protein MBANPS3_011603 [Mucor bainieri]